MLDIVQRAFLFKRQRNNTFDRGVWFLNSTNVEEKTRLQLENTGRRTASHFDNKNGVCFCDLL